MVAARPYCSGSRVRRVHAAGSGKGNLRPDEGGRGNRTNNGTFVEYLTAGLDVARLLTDLDPTLR